VWHKIDVWIEIANEKLCQNEKPLGLWVHHITFSLLASQLLNFISRAAPYIFF
jgi:hypothetical protein